MAEKLEAVTQADRELYVALTHPVSRAAVDIILSGSNDHSGPLQQIARHRLTATPDRSDDALAEERDKIAWLVAAGMWGDEAANLYFDPRYNGSPDIRRGQAKHTADRIVAHLLAHSHPEKQA